MADVKRFDRKALIASARQFLEQYQTLKEAGFINAAGDFFPSILYPPITMYEPITPEEFFAGYRVAQDGTYDIYVHFPFCEQRCFFCHYPAKLGHREAEKDRYLDALEKELEISSQLLGVERFKARSVLVGGGTPTRLTPAQLRRFLDFFTRRVDLSACTQFNYDVDPKTLLGPDGSERLRIMRDHGVDRLTIGVQSFNDRTLVNMNRHHDAQQALDSIDAARKLDYQLNIEFIFGYPGQTLDSWLDDMELAMSQDVDEIQLYRLKVEAYGDYQGAIKEIVRKNTLSVPSDIETLIMKKAAIDMLTTEGFTENIRRVFGRSKKIYSHYAWNQCCLLHEQLGFGLTAFSNLRDRFCINTQHFEEYYAATGEGRLPVNRGLVRSDEEQKRRDIILPLKNSFVQKTRYRERTGIAAEDIFRTKLALLEEYGLVVEDGQKIATTPLGSFFADEVAQQFYSPRYMPFPRDNYAAGPLNPYNNQDI